MLKLERAGLKLYFFDSLSANMIHICVNYDTTLLRDFMLKESNKCSFIQSIILGITSQDDTGVQEQLSDVLQIILDPDSLGMV
jgi:hypothetical protein